MTIAGEFDFGYRPTARESSRAGEIVVDQFAGGGGASMGIERALGRAVDVAINHDRQAVAMHEINHPATRHLCEDIYDVDPFTATRGRDVGLMWASPDCKHFSRAKGGKPVERKIRALAWVVIRWAKAIKPRVIMLENVREFADWGPLDKNNVPCKRRKGQTYKQWLGRLRGLGYAVETRVLNAADYGAPTHRRRLFLIARRDGLPIRWPSPTHGPGRKHAYRTAAECIDWSMPTPSIFLTPQEAKALNVRRPLKEKTLRRIALGIKRYVLDNPTPFLVQVNHGGHDYRVPSIDDPMPTVTGSHGTGMVAPILAQRNGEAKHQSTRGQTVDRPMNTITPREGGGFNLVAGNLIHYHDEKGNELRGSELGDPQPVQTTENRFALVGSFLAQAYGGMVGKESIDPLPTVTSKDHNQLVAANILKFRGDSTGTAADEPIATITSGQGSKRPAGAAHAMGIAAANLVSHNHGEKQWHACNDPLRVVTSNNHAALVYAFLCKYFSTAIGQDLNDAMHTQTAKPRFALVTVNGDPYMIADIGMRMLTPRELARAQGFPDDYVLLGSKAQQVKAIGNSVCPVMAEVLVKANYKRRQLNREDAKDAKEIRAEPCDSAILR